MDKLTIEDINKIASILKVEKGVEVKVVPNKMMKKGIAVLMMHPEDMEDFKEMFLPNPNIFPYDHRLATLLPYCFKKTEL